MTNNSREEDIYTREKEGGREGMEEVGSEMVVVLTFTGSKSIDTLRVIRL